jgi:hypothetical protein
LPNATLHSVLTVLHSVKGNLHSAWTVCVL